MNVKLYLIPLDTVELSPSFCFARSCNILGELKNSLSLYVHVEQNGSYIYVLGGFNRRGS